MVLKRRVSSPENVSLRKENSTTEIYNRYVKKGRSPRLWCFQSDGLLGPPMVRQ